MTNSDPRKALAYLRDKHDAPGWAISAIRDALDRAEVRTKELEAEVKRQRMFWEGSPDKQVGDANEIRMKELMQERDDAVARAGDILRGQRDLWDRNDAANIEIGRLRRALEEIKAHCERGAKLYVIEHTARAVLSTKPSEHDDPHCDFDGRYHYYGKQPCLCRCHRLATKPGGESHDH